MDIISATIIPDNKIVDLNLYILDPLSVIIKLAILSNKAIGTKIHIDKNVIYFQEPGPFQSLCRIYYNDNKTDLQYIYNPIEIACKNYLSKQSIQQNPKIKDLFKCAQNGLTKLTETYKSCSMIRICLYYYIALIANYLDEKMNDALFKKDHMTPFYNQEMLTNLYSVWSQERIRIVLNLTNFLINDEQAESNVKSLETIMENIDKEIQGLV
uniref:Uncharacterized protein n=1 Tax=viral metagenome TaxID=1070528 RepID=A0A6C0IUI5_9ZZZZ